MNTNEESTATIEEGDSGDQPVLPTADQQPIHQQAAQFARQHPVITVAGGLAIGALAAALIPDRNRKYIARQSSQLAEAITATGAAIAQQAASQASSAGSTLRDQAASLAERAGQAGHASIEQAQALIGRSKPEPTPIERILQIVSELKDRSRR